MPMLDRPNLVGNFATQGLTVAIRDIGDSDLGALLHQPQARGFAVAMRAARQDVYLVVEPFLGKSFQ